MEIKQYATILWRWAWLIIITAVLAAGAANIISGMQTPIYQATTTVLIDQAPDVRTADITLIMLSERLASTYAQLMTKRPVLEEVVKRLSLDVPPDGLKGAIHVNQSQESQILDVRVQHADPVIAADIANILVEVFSEQNASMQSSRYGASKENLNTQLVKLDEQIQEKKEIILKLVEVIVFYSFL